ncbi:MAG: hypothetical protein FJ405_17840 [Verrucomicrobia bacterium]|nr:hypothetical protein [Verrucomicrobiota bacterium]
MGWFKKKRDPVSERARDLNDQIRKLEAQIADLSARGKPEREVKATPSDADPRPKPLPGFHPPSRREPVFESVNQARLQDLTTRPPQYNELGVKKYDLPAAWKKLTSQFQAPVSKNPKLVDLLATGTIQGMRPLRYEKRIARRRFIALFILLLLVLWGTFAVLWRG